jgi:hypothetical protein
MGLTQRTGNVKFTSRLPEIAAEIEREAEIRAREMAVVVRTEALRVVRGERHGRYYRIPGTHRPAKTGKARFAPGQTSAQAPKGGWLPGAETETGAASLLSSRKGAAGRRGYYRASAPGEPPARRFGKLIQSIQMRTRMNRQSATAWVGSDEKYAVWLEKGTKRMAPRPWLIVAFNNMLDKLRTIATRKVPLR